jgi:hypothetical protein
MPLGPNQTSHAIRAISGVIIKRPNFVIDANSTITTPPLTHAFIALLLILFSAFSFAQNSLSIVSDKYFREFGGSEHLVLDGLLNGKITGVLKLGTFTQPTQSQFNIHLDASEHYDANSREGIFRDYKSQFGFQVYIYHAICKYIGSNISLLHFVTAFMMALVIAGFYVGLTREFSIAPALAFSIALLLSPWITVFARNLYWVEFTWFLPSLVVLFFGRRALNERTAAYAQYSFLFVAFLLRFLCGYEYATTIVLAAIPVMLLHVLRKNYPLSKFIAHAASICFTAVAAFSLALVIHARSMEGDTLKGLNYIATVAEKRLVSIHSPFELAEMVCKQEEEPENFTSCYNQYSASLLANPAKVFFRYLAMNRFLPWLDFYTSITAENKEDLKNIMLNLNVSHLRTFLHSAPQSLIVAFVIILINCISFLVFCSAMLTVVCLSRDRLSLVTLLSLVSSVSWLLIAKGHSYVHTHLNYVLWYILFIPFAAFQITCQWERRNTKTQGPAQSQILAHALLDG